MQNMKRKELITKYLKFFKSKQHKIIPAASLIPENDPTVLFTTAGMHPLVPFILGQKHPQGKRLVNVQPCIRTVDIEEVGDTTHLTFFEMLGNWSLGDYWKKEAIEMSYEFLTKHLKFNPQKLHVTVFTGDKDAPRDKESAKAWQQLGIPKNRIYYLGKEENWWGPAGKTGPCGPCTEMFIDTGKRPCSKHCKPGCNCGKYFEVWNDVFMEYNLAKEGKYTQLKQRNVDTGMGVERTIAMLQGKATVYETELFMPLINQIEKISGKKYGKDKGQTRSMRIIADHLKAATFILAETIQPSNLGQGYVLRRLIRRAIRYGKELGMENFTKEVAESVFDIYSGYHQLNKTKKKILEEFEKEEEKFEQVIKKGLKIAENIFAKKIPIPKGKFVKLMQLKDKTEIFRQTFRNKKAEKGYKIREAGISEKEIDKATISGEEAFLLFQSYGFPIEMIIELVREKNLFVDVEGFEQESKKHQEISRKATAGIFKSGLADKSELTTKLHTATHILHAALRGVLGKHVQQKGSNITAERLRFDFSHDKKLSEGEIKKVEQLVNKKIQAGLPVTREETTIEEAKKAGALAFFAAKYGEKVSVYSIGKAGEEFSKEVCAGPHVKNTKELGKFKIVKEESIAAGVRRIKAVLE